MSHVDRIRREAAYLEAPTKWAVRLALQGPRWIPIGVRRVPLKVCSAVMYLHVLMSADRHG